MTGRFPYPGLRPFNRDESDLFFGREEQTDELLRRLDRHRFLAMVGGSGCGKSSLVRAGLIAALESGFMANAGVRWCIAMMRPGSHPMERLVSALLESGVIEDVDDEATLGFLRSTLNRGPRGLTNALQHNPLPKDTNFLLVVDQFEELFRISRQEDRDQADAFVSLLLESVRQSEVPIHVIMTMRSDFLGDTSLFSGLPEAVNDGIYLIPRLSRNQRQASIEGPARVFGGRVEPDLVNRLLNDMAADATQLPLLQHLLMRMWQLSTLQGEELNVGGDVDANAAEADTIATQFMTMDLYQQAGGLSDALNQHAEEIYQGLSDEHKKVAKVMFSCLCERSVQGDSTRNIRRPTSVEDIAAVADSDVATGAVDADMVITVADHFRAEDCHFITPDPREVLFPNTLLDISHEALMMSWKRLSRWMDDRSVLIETFEEILKEAKRRERDIEGTRLQPTQHWFAPLRGGKRLWVLGANYFRVKEWEKHTNRAWGVLRPDDYALVNKFVTASIRRRKEYIGLILALFSIVVVTGSVYYDTVLEDGFAEGVETILRLDDDHYLRTDLSEYINNEFVCTSVTSAIEEKFQQPLPKKLDSLPSETDIAAAELNWSDRAEGLLASECSEDLKKMVEGEKSRLVEVFVTDIKGYNVCMSAETSDYVQSDEGWWLGVYESEQSGIGRLEYDDSAGAASVAIYLPVKNDSDQLIGVAKAVFDLWFIVEVARNKEKLRKYTSICDG